MRKNKFTAGAAIMLVIMTVAATFNVTFYLAGDYYSKRFGNLAALESKYAKFNEVTSVIDKYFIADYEYDKALDMAMAGYVNGLGDRWSGYYDADQTRQINESYENSYVGIGVTINGGEENPFLITKVTSGGPAEAAGIQPLDVLTHVDGVHVSDIGGQNEVVNKVRGLQGTTVKITVLRGEQSISFNVERTSLVNERVTGKMLDEKLGYIHIESFDKGVDTQFAAKLNQLIKDGARGFIFDVRMNPGGQVSVMVDILDRLLPQGQIISMKDNMGNEESHTSNPEWIDMPMVVIVNERSISAAEFFGAALQEYAVADIVGTKTIGKGYAQSLFTLSDGSSINLSIMRYYTPKGVSLAGTGITPDYEVDLSDEAFYNFYTLELEDDTQLLKAIEVLKDKLPEYIEDIDSTEPPVDTTAAAG